MTPQNKDAAFAVLYFLLATVISAMFIASNYWLYRNDNAMILSGNIAGAKWLIQIVAALFLLKELKWIFIRLIGFVCFIGSVVLLVYYIFNFLPLPLGTFSRFIFSIGRIVLVMIGMYYNAVKKTGLSIAWFLGWIVCLAIAILLQMFVVF